MKVKFIGFGGGYIEYPVYENEEGRLFFDLNDGRGELSLYSGAYRHPEDGDICGEPYSQVETEVECDEPFKRHPRELDYMMLSRLESDCKYFLGYGNGYEGHLYYKAVEKHCKEMAKLYESFTDEDKPEWLSMEMIMDYKRQMLEKRGKEIC